MNRPFNRSVYGLATCCAAALALDGGAVAAQQSAPASQVVRSVGEMNRLLLDLSVAELRSKARPTSRGQCAQNVEAALEAGGVKLSEATKSRHAKDYGPFLESSGFRKIPAENYRPQPGDIVVFQPYPGGPPAGHIAMYAGDGWISDFEQKDVYGGSGYRKSGASHVFYRHGNVVASTSPVAGTAAGSRPRDATPAEKPAAGGKTASSPAAEQPQPKDEQTAKLERRAKELAEKGLKPRDPAAPVDPNEAQPIIPEDCTIEIVTWQTEAAKERGSARYDVRSGVVASRLPDQNYPQSGNPQGYSFYGAFSASFSFAGSLAGNTITGTWTTAYSPQQAWGWKDGEKRTQFYRYETRQETRSEMRLVLNVDGTLSWSLHGVWRSKHQQLEGEGPPPKDQENTFEASGVGVWQTRKTDASSQENSP